MKAARGFAIETPTAQERARQPGTELVLRLQVGGAVYNLPLAGAVVNFFAQVADEAAQADAQMQQLTADKPLISLAREH